MKFKRLSEIGKITMGQSPNSSSYNEERRGIPFYQGNADFGEKYPSERVWCEEPKKIAYPEDILISVRAPIGALNYARTECCIGRGLAAIRIEDEFLRNYVFHLLKARNGELNRKGTGSTFKAIGKNVLEEILVPVIDRGEQECAMRIMDNLEETIRRKKLQMELLDNLVKARFAELFGNPVLNDKGWEQKTLAAIASKIGSGATPKGGKEAYRENGIALVRSMNVHNGRFEYKDLAHISDEQAGKLDNVTLEENDVLLNITGASVARSCVAPSEILPARVNQHVCIIRCKECIVPEFLNKLFINDNYQVLLRRMAGAGATREAITKQQVESLHIIMPPLEIQQRFADFVVQTGKSKAAVQKSLDETQVLFDSLMQKYFG